MPKSEIDKLKYWLDAEITLIHIFLVVILGAIIGGKFWFVTGVYTVISLIYFFKKASKLPKNYLR